MLRLPNDWVEPQGEPEPVIMTGPESDLLWEIAHHPQQKRTMLRPDAILMQVARARAADMAQRGYVGHVDPEGHGPNWHVTRAGFVLPDYYHDTDDANNIESIAAGQATAREVVAGWQASEGHWKHVAGLTGTFRAQVLCGLGYAANMHAERWGHWWVLITAP